MCLRIEFLNSFHGRISWTCCLVTSLEHLRASSLQPNSFSNGLGYRCSRYYQVDSIQIYSSHSHPEWLKSDQIVSVLFAWLFLRRDWWFRNSGTPNAQTNRFIVVVRRSHTPKQVKVLQTRPWPGVASTGLVVVTWESTLLDQHEGFAVCCKISVAGQDLRICDESSQGGGLQSNASKFGSLFCTHVLNVSWRLFWPTFCTPRSCNKFLYDVHWRQLFIAGVQHDSWIVLSWNIYQRLFLEHVSSNRVLELLSWAHFLNITIMFYGGAFCLGSLLVSSWIGGSVCLFCLRLSPLFRNTVSCWGSQCQPRCLVVQIRKFAT